MTDVKKLYLVEEEILPGAILKVCRAKEMLLAGQARTVGEAVGKAGVSRSAFYMYKDRVFPLESGSRGMEMTLHFVLETPGRSPFARPDRTRRASGKHIDHPSGTSRQRDGRESLSKWIPSGWPPIRPLF